MIMAADEYNKYSRRTHKKFFSTLKPAQLILALIMWLPLISPTAQEPSKSNYMAFNSADYAVIPAQSSAIPPAQSSAIPAKSVAKYEAISLAMSPAISPSSGSDGGGSSSSLQQIWIVQGNSTEEGILVFEYMAHGSLHHRLHPPAHQMYKPLSWKKRMEVAQQVACALQYLHDVARPAVVHGDIKSANVLLNEDDNAKLCDFGFASKAGPNSSIFHSTVASVKGSLGYLDPQYLKNGRLSSKSDVYSFGVLVIELITGLHAFDMHKAEALTSFTAAYVQDMDMMELIVDARLSGTFDKSELRSLCNVARLCVQEDGAYRPTMAEVVFQLSSSSMGLSSATTNQVQDDGNAFSSFSENIELCVYNSFDSDSITTKHLESRPHSM